MFLNMELTLNERRSVRDAIRAGSDALEVSRCESPVQMTRNDCH
jgi:hypothetical protein